MDNFNRQPGIIEPRVSQNEKKNEVGKFLDYVLETNPMKELYNWFKAKGHSIAANPISFRFWIGQLWVSHYSKALRRPDSSGFEHVFIGEVKNGVISGMHNWVRFYALENNRTENFDYKGLFTVKRFTRFLLISISQFVMMALVGLFAFEYLFTCILHYDYFAIPAAISAAVLAVVLKNYAERCYYGLYIAWSIQLFSGFLELYLVLNNRIMDGMFHDG